MDEEQEHKERPRPRVIDKRVSARTDTDSPTAAPGGDTPSLSSDSPRPADAGLRNSPGGEPPPSAAVQESARSAPPPAVGEPGASAPGAPGTTEAGEVWTPAQEEEMRAMARQIAETPSLEWVLNTAVHLANVAGTKLDLGAISDAQLAIDALGALIDGLGARLGTAEAPLRQTLAQLRMAYAEMVAAGS